MVILSKGYLFNKRYQLEQKLGQNFARQTWRARDLIASSPSLVIVKFIALDPQANWDDLKLFEREIKTLRNLNHNLIPRYKDHFSVEDRFIWLALVQEYIPGISLQELIDSGHKFTEIEIHAIATEILNILIYLHELCPAVLHRDIKPSNILLGRDKKIYLVDFGAVQACAASEDSTFTTVGTYGYTPIEQFGGKTIPASDIYALGATLIFLLTGKHPANLPQHALKIEFRHFSSVSHDFAHWIEKLTDPDPSQRFPSAHQALEELKSLHRKKYNSTITKPEYSRISLRRTLSELEIFMPRRGLKFHDLIIFTLMLALLISTIPFSFIVMSVALFYWFFGLSLAAFFIFSSLGSTYILLNKENCFIRWNILGFSCRKSRLLISRIDDIRLKKIDRLSGRESSFIEIKSESQKIQLGLFSSPISAVECQWIFQELQDWLKSK